MKTAIATDSNSGIFQEEGRKLGVYVLPMPVIIEGQTYYEGVDLSHEQFYQSLLERKQVATSQPAPETVTALWDRALSDGFDQVVYIPMSSGLSGSCQTARMLAESYSGRVQVADDHRISVTQRHAVMDALALAKKGLPATDIKAYLERTGPDSLIYIGVENLHFLKQGGRITPAAAALGSVLNLKPLLVIDGERLDAYAKVRGTANCKKRAVEAILKYADGLRGQGKAFRVGVAGTFADKKEEREWIRMVKSAFPKEDVHYDPLSFSIGCHVGPGSFGTGITVWDKSL